MSESEYEASPSPSSSSVLSSSDSWTRRVKKRPPKAAAESPAAKKAKLLTSPPAAAAESRSIMDMLSSLTKTTEKGAEKPAEKKPAEKVGEKKPAEKMPAEAGSSSGGGAVPTAPVAPPSGGVGKAEEGGGGGGKGTASTGKGKASKSKKSGSKDGLTSTATLEFGKIPSGPAVVCETTDVALSMTGDSGVLGRFKCRAPDAEADEWPAHAVVSLDLKGKLYSGPLLPTHTLLAVSISGANAKIEAIVDHYVPLSTRNAMVRDVELISGTLAPELMHSDPVSRDLAKAGPSAAPAPPAPPAPTAST